MAQGENQSLRVRELGQDFARDGSPTGLSRNGRPRMQCIIVVEQTPPFRGTNGECGLSQLLNYNDCQVPNRGFGDPLFVQPIPAIVRDRKDIVQSATFSHAWNGGDPDRTTSASIGASAWLENEARGNRTAAEGQRALYENPGPLALGWLALEIGPVARGADCDSGCGLGIGTQRQPGNAARRGGRVRGHAQRKRLCGHRGPLAHDD